MDGFMRLPRPDCIGTRNDSSFRHCEERSDEAISVGREELRDCRASLAMTEGKRLAMTLGSPSLRGVPNETREQKCRDAIARLCPPPSLRGAAGDVAISGGTWTRSITCT